MDELPEAVVGGVILLAIVAACLLVGSCVQDYQKSTPRVVEVMIVDKRYSPAHTDFYTTFDSHGNASVHSTYYPDSWSVEYADEWRHEMTVSSGTYEALHIGDKKVLRYDLGGGFWQARYNERFEFGPMVAERAMPVR